MGISVLEAPSLNMSDLVNWKDSIVDRLNKGVESLLKTAGAGSFMDGLDSRDRRHAG